MEITATKIPPTENYTKFAERTASQLKAKNPSWTKAKITAAVKQEWQKMTAQKAKSNIQRESSISQKENNVKISSDKKSQVSARKKLYFGQKNKTIDIESIRKTKRILKKSGGKQFISFLKFYQNKLHKEHPRWTSNQIEDIVNLLWRKKQRLDKLSREQKQKIFRALSGRAFYGQQKREQNVPNVQINKNWRRLPRQSKLYFKKLGAGINPFQKSTQNVVRLQEARTNLFSFMHKN